jgi:sugar phosphate permease
MKHPPRFHYAWVVVAVTFVTLLAAAGIRSTPGILIVPLEHEFGWSRATISAAVSVNLLLFGLISPFAAALLDSIGVRRTMALAMTLVAVGASLTTRMTQPWQMLLLWGVVVGCGSGMTSSSLSATVVTRWFHTSRGTVMGLLTASTATGQMIFLPLLALLNERYGWRSSVYFMVAVIAVIAPLVMLFMRNFPHEMGLRQVGDDGRCPDLSADPGADRNPFRSALNGLKVGLRSRDFWLLGGSFFVCGASTNGLIGTHLIPACVDHGIPEVRAAGLLAMMGILDLAGTTFSGWLSDRYNNRYLLAWYYGLRGLSLLGLPQALAGHSWGLTVFAIFYGLDWIATVPPTVRLTADVFGRNKVGIMFGWIFACHQIGAAVAAFGAGAIRTYVGDYFGAFLTSGLLCMIAVGLVLQIGGKEHKPAVDPA